MISDAIEYGGIYAKICALKAKFLTFDDYQKLASCASIKDLTEALTEKENYKESAEEALSHGVSRITLESSLYRVLYRDYTALYSFITNENQRKYLDTFFLRFEINLIKRMLRRLYDQRDIQNVIPKSDKFLSTRMKLDVERLGLCTSFSDFKEAIKGTAFFDVIDIVNSETGTLFDYEMQLDFYRYIKTQKYQNKYLNKRDRLSQKHINGTEADILNIMWIHRSKTYYQIDNDRIFSHIIPINYMLGADKVKELATCEDSEFLGIIDKTHYKGIFTDLSAGGMDKSYTNCMNKLHNAERKKNPYSISSVTWYLYYKMQEIKNLTTLTECIRYNLPSAISLKKLNIALYKVGDSYD